MLPKKLEIALQKHKILININFNKEAFEYRKEKILKLYSKNNFNNLNNSLIEFLFYFSDKELLFINNFGKPDNMHFKTKRVFKLYPNYIIKAIEKDFNLNKIIPFAMIYRENMILFIDKNDDVYANLDGLLVHYGKNPIDALINILNGNALKRIEL